MNAFDSLLISRSASWRLYMPREQYLFNKQTILFSSCIFSFCSAYILFHYFSTFLKKKKYFSILCVFRQSIFFLLSFCLFHIFVIVVDDFVLFFINFYMGLYFFLLFSKYTIYMVILCGPTESNRNKFRKYDYRTRLLYSNGFLYLCFLLFFFIFTLFQLMCAWARCEWQQILLPLRTVFLCCCRCWRCCSRFSCLLLNSFSVFFHYLA